MTIYQTSPYGGPSASNLFCAQAWNANTVYRELPAASTTPTSKSSLTTAAITSSPTVTSIKETSAATISSTTPTARESVTTSSSGSSSKAWIAGPVVGAVVGIAIIVGGAIFFLSRKQRRTFHPQPQYDLGSGYPYGGNGSFVQQQQQQPQERHELYQEHFAPKGPATVYELH
ncbi:hypothetical protein ASPACDRAFT_46574 [Aspergillus aculeatus ATCC 16872]|uniref:Mid2 domain-containing protein n=1 Tax=Aspergillus aculeatus (strain ATCC 16872 / CBS 172.66 / WB 5094) TaxID=690307 RepID=A0A1L9WJT0_ASPA1|nr:uncharacterized protein ASPACDRAFT_46574 [Aspergillus aculeatus ATCC 16872]OJJ96412.1 hypothetical protein ASPACDRAFT_46574 [Aspergillus aculeatus ATCC 16872]